MADPFATDVTRWYRAHGRDLPWRRTGAGAWAVLVREFMLQQTPVTRVVPVWRAWMARGVLGRGDGARRARLHVAGAEVRRLPGGWAMRVARGRSPGGHDRPLRPALRGHGPAGSRPAARRAPRQRRSCCCRGARDGMP